jgi:hypothetical protein
MNRKSNKSDVFAGLLLMVCLALAGCHSAQVANPLTGKLAGNDADSQLEFWHTLATRPVTSNDEAFHGLLLFADGQDSAKTYDARVDTLKSRKMLPSDFKAPANQAITRGDMAVAVCRILEIRGGMMLHIAPRSGRYALRELMFIEVYPPSSSNQTFSGSEFLGIIGRVEDYQRGTTAESPAALLPGEIKKPATQPAKTQPAGK